MANKRKNKNQKVWYETKWAKLIFLFVFFGWLYHLFSENEPIHKDELVELRVTTKGELENVSSSRGNYCKFLTTKEYTNKFGFLKSGCSTFRDKLTASFDSNTAITIKIHQNQVENLNKEIEAIPVYYMSMDNIGLIFNEEEFNKGSNKYYTRILTILAIIFLVCLLGILKSG